MKLALICGGPSLERGISLNSARSVLDHLESDNFDITPFYLDYQKRAYKISKAQLYSNNPSDFDFKLKQTAHPLNIKSFVKALKAVNLVFPVMHGIYGEDGGIQYFLEQNDIPFVGSSSAVCKQIFDKFNGNKLLKKLGFFTLPSVVLKIYHNDHQKIIENFFATHKICRAVVKPASGGSSIGVFSVSNPQEALKKTELLFSKRMDTRVVVEPFAKGVEFTIIILENRFGLPVALPPTEIETDYTKHQIFDFRKKYLPTRQVIWHCPPRFDNKTIEKIQAQAEQLFTLFGMHDFARFDGWVLADGNIWFCDFNPVSGMEQNSFLFQQASRIGMTHSDVLRHILEQACGRYNIEFPKNDKKSLQHRKKVNIIMGGDNSERQVSLMSGTNVWLKLRQSKKYQPHLYLLNANSSVWRLPYHLCLNHTVEEITANCRNYQTAKARLNEFEERARLRLGLSEFKNKEEFFEPQQLTLNQLTKESNFIFIALHGGDGENGNMQKLLREKGVKFNGPEEKVSQLCMDKWATSNLINNLRIKGINSIPGKIVKTKKLLKFSSPEIRLFWRKTRKELCAKTLIIKPRADGCTTGVVHLYSSNDLKKYLGLIKKRVAFIPKQIFKGQLDIIEMPPKQPPYLLFEKFIETDIVRVKGNKLKHRKKTGWVEVTVGVLEEKNKIKVFNPSLTIAEGEVLTVEEKFQGGTGINLTPPPTVIVKKTALTRTKQLIGELTRKISINGYARIDCFMQVNTGDVLVIEINTLPGLTPSTVFFHQGLAEDPPLFPRQLLEKLIENKSNDKICLC